MAKKRKVEEPNSFETDQEDNDSEFDSDQEEHLQEEDIEEDIEVDDDEEEEEKGTETTTEEDEEDIAKILEQFNKEQLIELLRKATSNDPKLIEEINRVADSDPAQRKLFVHGLGWETTSEKLQEFYSQYGEIEDCNVVADKVTGKSKGYGFLCFKHRKSAQKALKEPQKKIENRMTACQLASAGPVSTNFQPQQQQSTNSSHNPPQESLQRKIYVGNVHSDISSDRLLAFFSKYGEIEEGPLGFDKQTGKSKGYALFIYRTIDGARKALEEPSKNFEGLQLYCQKATDKQKNAAAPNAPPKMPSGGASVGGYIAPGGVAYSAPNGALGSQGSVANPALYGQGLMAPHQYGQGVAPIQAALAVLAAAGQNPAAFGVSPATIGPFNPAMAAAMSAGQPGAMQGYGMVNQVYQYPQAHQPIPYQSGPVGQGPTPRSNSGMRPTGKYMGR
ncbi:Ubp1-associated protein 2a-like [Thalictrum thalictroides]|uniref:Ubp1-associated protein 2a-like n=1 Tax=Thalictrum thalictroides TaxID=46969 RepID=A0A7J6WAC6_THATH|nr:Ubp1-associated protein 2a-like [Thalictrum thalictroides]